MNLFKPTRKCLRRPPKTPITRRQPNYSFTPDSEEIGWKGVTKETFGLPNLNNELPDDYWFTQRISAKEIEDYATFRNLIPDLAPKRKILTALEKEESLNRLRAYTNAAILPS